MGKMSTCTSVWDLYGIQTEIYFVWGISALLDILWIVVSGSVFSIIGVSLRFTSSRPKHSNSAVEILVHSNRVMVSFSSPKQLISCSRKPWDLYGIQIELWFLCGMSSLPDILCTVVSWYVAPVIGVSLLVDWVALIATIVD